jgi:hypothetical protein
VPSPDPCLVRRACAIGAPLSSTLPPWVACVRAWLSVRGDDLPHDGPKAGNRKPVSPRRGWRGAGSVRERLSRYTRPAQTSQEVRFEVDFDVDLWIDGLLGGSVVPAIPRGEQPLDDLHVLLRHRLRSIAPEPRAPISSKAPPKRLSKWQESRFTGAQTGAQALRRRSQRLSRAVSRLPGPGEPDLEQDLAGLVAPVLGSRAVRVDDLGCARGIGQRPDAIGPAPGDGCGPRPEGGDVDRRTSLGTGVQVGRIGTPLRRPLTPR